MTGGMAKYWIIPMAQTGGELQLLAVRVLVKRSVSMQHKNIRNEETARGQLMTYTRQFLVPHSWNNPIFSYPICHPYPYSHPTVF